MTFTVSQGHCHIPNSRVNLGVERQETKMIFDYYHCNYADILSKVNPLTPTVAIYVEP